MKLLYNVKGIGVYIDSNTENKWISSTKNKLNNQLKGFESDNKNDDIIQTLYIKNYKDLYIENFKKVCIVPDSSLYKDNVFVELEQSIAYKVEKNKLIMWCGKESWLSLPFMLHLLFKQRNMMFVHGAGISLDNSGILLLAFGGIGKTSFISGVIKNPLVKILGDDLILIDNNGFLYSYERPFCLYNYHQMLFQDYFRINPIKFRKLNLKNKVVRKLKSKIGIKDSVIYNYVTVTPAELISNEKIETKKVPLDIIYILRRYKNIKSIQVESKVDINEAVNFAVNVIMHEWYALSKQTFNRLAQETLSLSEYINFYEKTAFSCFKNAKEIKKIDVPEELHADVIALELSKIILFQ